MKTPVSAPRAARKPLSILLAATLCGAVLSQTGCIEFNRQTMAYRHDAKSDTLYIFQEFRGIYGADKKDGLSDNEVQQIQSVLDGQRTFFFANWILEFNREELRKWIEKPPDSPPSPESEKAARKQYVELIRLLLDNVKIENDPLHLDNSEQLAGTQRVTIKNLSRIVKTANDTIHAFLQTQAESVNEDKAKLYRAAVKKRMKFIRIDGNRISADFPLPRSIYESDFEKDEANREFADRFRKAGGSLGHRNGTVEYRLGKPDEKITRLTMDVHSQPYSPNVLEHLRKEHKILPKFEVAAALEKFLRPRR